MSIQENSHHNLPQALLVEDDPIIQKVHQVYLSKLGFQVTVIKLGQEAIQLSQIHHYHCILLDLGLPDVGGEFVLSSIRSLELETQKHTPIIVTTAHGTEETLEACMNQGASAAFIKPITQEGLRKVIQKITLEA